MDQLINNQLVNSRAEILPRALSFKARDPDATRARILKAAKAEFARKGLSGARVDDIAARARSNKRMLYHYFGNKEELFRITLEVSDMPAALQTMTRRGRVTIHGQWQAPMARFARQAGTVLMREMGF